jgi:hypothetical protein
VSGSYAQLALIDRPEKRDQDRQGGIGRKANEQKPLDFKLSSHGLEAHIILRESIAAHECVINALIADSADLSASAWVDHKASWTEISLETKRLGDVAAHHESVLNIAIRREQQATALESDSNLQDRTATQAANLQSPTRQVVHHRRAVEALEQARLEIKAEHERGAWLLKRARHTLVVRAAKIVERARQARTLNWLQHCLKITCIEYKHACVAYNTHKNAFTSQRVMSSKLRALNVRSELQQQGQNRRSTEEMGLSFFRSEVRRLLADRESKIERIALLNSVAHARQECDDVWCSASLSKLTCIK